MTTQKFRIAAPPNDTVHGWPSPPKAQVVATGVGPITLGDKLKGYYKGIIAVLTAILVVVNEVTPVLNFLPIDKNYVTVAIAVIGSVLTFLKANEHWVDDA